VSWDLRKSDPLFLALLALVSFLLLYNLDYRPFWQDEAETACLARNVLKFGTPRAFDGINLISQEEGREAGADHLWRWSPWMQIYLTAGAFYLAQPSTTAGRFPFAVLGILCVCLTYLLIKRHFRDLLWARLAAALLGLSVPFLMYSRQCRYYSLATLLVLGSLYAFRMDWQQRWGPALLLLISFGLLFHANYLLFFTYGAAFLAAAILLYHRELPVKRTLLLAAGVALVALQGTVFFQVQKQGGMFDLTRIASNLQCYFQDLFQFMAPLPVIGCLLLYWLWLAAFPGGRERLQADREARFTMFLGLIVLFNILIISLAPQGEHRYLIHLYPLCAMVLGWAVCRVAAYHKVSAVLLAFLLLFTNWLHLLPVTRLNIQLRPADNSPYMLTYPNFPLKLYLSELVYGYPDVNRNLIDFFQAQARPGDTIVTTYGDLPLQFYTSCVVFGGLQGRLPEAGELPKFVVKRWHTRWNRRYDLTKSEAFILGLRLAGDYEPLVLPFADEEFGNRADPYYHRFVPDQPPLNQLIIYRLRSHDDAKTIKHLQ
jgi:hypothetical protein